MAKLLSLLVNLWRDRRGNVTVLFALALVPLVGAAGLATEGSGWLLRQRMLQNVADQAALAAATNGCLPGATCASVGPTYVQEAAAVGAKYGVTNGVDNSTFTADTITTPAPCGAGADTCYRVTATHLQSFQLLRILGFAGDATNAAGAPAQTIQARAVAKRLNTTAEFCMTVLSNSRTAVNINGGAQLDLTGCSFYAPNGGASCNGQSGSTISYAFVAVPGQASDNCGLEVVNPLTLEDPYASLAQNNLSGVINQCGGIFKQAVRNAVDAAHTLSGTHSYSATSPQCGDFKLGPPGLTVTGNSTLVIENGRLDLAGQTLTVAANASLTLVFSGTAASNSSHFPMSSVNGGVLDFSAPASGAWSGVAIYQDPVLTRGVDFTVSGSTPQFDITGLIYAPKANLTISGAINHATAGLACLDFFTNQITINGTASIFATPTVACPRAGLNPGSVQTIQKVVLVQ